MLTPEQAAHLQKTMDKSAYRRRAQVIGKVFLQEGQKPTPERLAQINTWLRPPYRIVDTSVDLVVSEGELRQMAVKATKEGL